ncbi:hypothetical protein [Candidatus Synechococcus spongiarum]|uniref:hypothetical protein n=1 Tax=Candidatus Synechococcus spongiarum TaxID=431041 RepID=UPI0012690689|nr:hypothetical protein [Candidatus Synechococcus spongiarum]
MVLIDLANNDLTSLPEDIFNRLSSLKIVKIYGNYLSCHPRLPSGTRFDNSGILPLSICGVPPEVNVTAATGGGEGDSRG